MSPIPHCLTRDWPEDHEHENGNYYNTCRECGEAFIGHKRRISCRVCATPKSVLEAIRKLEAGAKDTARMNVVRTAKWICSPGPSGFTAPGCEKVWRVHYEMSDGSQTTAYGDTGLEQALDRILSWPTYIHGSAEAAIAAAMAHQPEGGK